MLIGRSRQYGLGSFETSCPWLSAVLIFDASIIDPMSQPLDVDGDYALRGSSPAFRQCDIRLRIDFPSHRYDAVMGRNLKRARIDPKFVGEPPPDFLGDCRIGSEEGPKDICTSDDPDHPTILDDRDAVHIMCRHQAGELAHTRFWAPRYNPGGHHCGGGLGLKLLRLSQDFGQGTQEPPVLFALHLPDEVRLRYDAHQMSLSTDNRDPGYAVSGQHLCHLLERSFGVGGDDRSAHDFTCAHRP